MTEKEPKSLGDRLKDLPIEIQSLIEKRIELITLGLTATLANIIGESVPKIIGGLLASIAFLFLLVGLATFLNDLWDSAYLGYLAVGGGLLAIGIPLVLAKKAAWNRSIRDSVIQKLTAETKAPENKKLLESTNQEKSISLPETEAESTNAGKARIRTH
jgi:hypothetical protein